jgi:protein involved in polysaccharide export with SLBB domain
VDYLKIPVLAIGLAWLSSVSVAQCQERTIKPGDAIEIVVYEHEELSETVVVSPEGTVDSPFLKGIPVDEMTLERFQEILVTQLSRYMERTPLVKVRFTESYPVRVTVLGQVLKPGKYLIQNTSTIQGAIGEAGGFTSGATLSQVKLIRARGEGTNGDAANQIVNMERFYLQGDPSYLPMLKDGDTIVVPGDPLANAVKVLGGVNNPGSFDVLFPANIVDVIFLAGGPTDDANLSAVKVTSRNGQDTRETQFNVKELLKSRQADRMPLVAPGDIVHVPQKALTWKKFVRVMRDVSSFATLYLIIRFGRRS